MTTNFDKELNIIVNAIKDGYKMLGTLNTDEIVDKSKYDLVTDIDISIEEYISSIILKNFPNDRILGEEKTKDTEVIGRTWTIDPIDGTYNMANKIKLYGIQCSMFYNQEVVLSAIYLPAFDELYTAVKNGGAYLNGENISTKACSLDHCIVSFGDFPHSRANDRNDENKIISYISDHVAKIRMFGAACIDFAWLSAGRTNGVVIFTKNKWDIAPGILLAQEAGAILRSLDGDYSFDSRVIIATSSEELYACIKECLDCSN